LCFLSFWHSSLVIFKLTENTFKLQRFILKFLSVLLWNILPFYFFFTSGKFNASVLVIGIVFSSLSLLIYWLCVSSVRDFKLAVIHGNIEGNKILDRGIYKYIRHPFYTSYLFCYLGLVFCLPQIPVIITVCLLVCVYIRAAWVEEKNLLASAEGENYASYKKSTGMFLPKIF